MNMGRMEEGYRNWEKKNELASKGPGSRPAGSTVIGGNPRWHEKFREDLLPSERQRRRSRKMSHPPSLNLVPELARFKVTPPAYYEPSGLQRPFMGQRCPNCAQGSQEILFTQDIPTMGIHNVLAFNTPRRGLIARYFPHIYLAFTEGINYDYPTPITLVKRVLGNRRVLAAINKAAISDSEGRTNEEEHYTKELNRHALRANRVLSNMASSISNIILRITGWMLLKFLGMILFGVQVHRGQIEMIKRASKIGVPLAIIPTHRSHLDYVLMSFILYIYGIRVPFIAAGDNLNIPVFGWVMRKLGGFFIKRKLDKVVGKKDHVYRALLHTYMEEVLRSKQNLEFFIEGGRSRSGKALAPKGGLLSVVVDAYFDGVISDAYIIPASVSYEKILDGDFTNEQMGRPKRKETFVMAMLGIWSVFTEKFGHVRVNFAEPFSLKEYLDSAQMITPVVSDLSTLSPINRREHGILKKTVSEHSLYGTDVVIEDQRQLIKGLGEHIIYDAVRVNTIMSSNLLAFLLLTKHRQGVEFNKLVQDAEWLRGEIIGRGRDIGFSGQMDVVVKHVLALLGTSLISVQPLQYKPDILKETREVIKGKTEAPRELVVVPNISIPEVFRLSYYSNSVISVFLLESVVANALIAVANQDMYSLTGALDNRITLCRDKVLHKATELCDLLQFEFIFVPPCGCLYTALCDAVDRLTVSEVLCPDLGSGDASVSQDSKWAQRVAASSAWANDSDEEDACITTKEEQLTVNTSPDRLEKLLFYQSVLGPLIESYWLTACNLVRLLDRDLTESEFSNLVNDYAKDRVKKGLAVFTESCAMDTLRNAWRLYQHWKVLDTYQDAEKIKMVHLKEPYRSEIKLGCFIDKIEAFRM